MKKANATNLFLVATLLTTSIGLFAVTTSMADSDDDPFTVEVSTGDFSIYVVESARLDARQSVTLSSELPSNKAKVVELAEEGRYVEQGEIVARFDPAPFDDDIQQLTREYEDVRAALIQAEAELQIQIRNGKLARDQSQYAIELAGLKLRNLKEADSPLRLAQARHDVSSAQRAHETAKKERVTQQEMLKEGFGNESMLQEAMAEEKDKRNGVELVQQQLQVLEEIVLPAEVNQANMELENKKRELEHVEQATLHTLAKQNAVLMRLRNQVEALRESLDRAEAMLAKTTIVAPVSGFVVHKEISVMSERRKVQIGDSVWNRHGFMVIPDMSSLVGYIHVREQDVGKLAAGQAVKLRPEAYPDLLLTGSVETVGTLAADRASREENQFQVRIAIEGVDPRLRPGMRAEASILTHELTDVLRVPVEAVFYEEGNPVCFVWRRGSAKRRKVDLGETDGDYIVVREGLEDGDEVLLTYPRRLMAAEST